MDLGSGDHAWQKLGSSLVIFSLVSGGNEFKSCG